MKCQICNGTTTKQEHKLGLFFECEDCGFLYKKNHLTKLEEKDRYDKHNNTPEDERYLNYMQRIYDVIKDEIKGDVLDYGAGEGRAFSHIHPSDSYDLFYFPELPTKKYDTICTFETVEHFINPLEEFTKMLSFLKEDGTLIIRTETKPEVWDNWWYIRDETHRSFYTDKTFKEIKKIYGLDYMKRLNDSIIVFRRK